MSKGERIEEIDVIIERRDQNEGVGVHAGADAVDYEWREETLVEHIGRFARENPASAALVGAGLVWMALGGGRNIARGANIAGAVVGDVARVATSAASQTARTARAVGDAVATTAESAQDAAARAGKTVARTAQAAVGTAEEAAAQAADVAGREASRAEDYVESAAKRTASVVSRATDEISDELRDAVDAVRRGGERALRTAGDLARSQPLLASALWLATGAGLASLLPRTRPEKELLSEYGREAVQAARRRSAGPVVGSVRTTAHARPSQAVHEAARRAAEEAAERVLRQADGISEVVLTPPAR